MGGGVQSLRRPRRRRIRAPCLPRCRIGSASTPGPCGSLAGETFIDRQAHAPAAASGVHLHKRQGLGSAAGADKSADRRGQIAKGDLVGHGV
jgi:hypothetical protein